MRATYNAEQALNACEQHTMRNKHTCLAADTRAYQASKHRMHTIPKQACQANNRRMQAYMQAKPTTAEEAKGIASDCNSCTGLLLLLVPLTFSAERLAVKCRAAPVHPPAAHSLYRRRLFILRCVLRVHSSGLVSERERGPIAEPKPLGIIACQRDSRPANRVDGMIHRP